MGRVTGDSQCTTSSTCGASSYYSIYYGYDLLGDMTGQRNMPEGGILYTRSYDTAARLNQLQSSYVDSYHPGTLLTVNTFNALGEATQETLGNGIVRNLAYDNLGRMTSRTDGSVYNFSLGYEPNSNLHTASDSLTGSWTYSYDDFARLSTSSKTGQAFNYKYDRFDNRLQQNVTTGTGPAPQYTFDANNHITGFSYDAAGDVTSDGTHSYTYDAEGRITAVDGGATDSFVYNADGQVVRRSFNNYPPMDFVLDLSGKAVTELANGGVWDRSELYAAGTHVATYVDGITYFFHPDWVGSTRVETKYDGTVAGSMTNLPFGDGQVWTGRLPSWANFAGGDVDEGSYLDLFMFRQYSPTQGRWMMPDPAGMAAADSTNPQSWNRYAYVMDNPVNAVDPTGLGREAPGDPFYDRDPESGGAQYLACGPDLDASTGAADQGIGDDPGTGIFTREILGASTWGSTESDSSLGDWIMYQNGGGDQPSGPGGPIGGDSTHMLGRDAGLTNGSRGIWHGGNNVNSWGTPIFTLQQQKCIDDHERSAAAIGTKALDNATNAFKSSVPSLDWAGAFSVNQLIRNLAAGGPIKWGPIGEAAALGLVAKAGWGTLKGASIAMYGMMKANVVASASSCLSGDF